MIIVDERWQFTIIETFAIRKILQGELHCNIKTQPEMCNDLDRNKKLDRKHKTV